MSITHNHPIIYTTNLPLSARLSDLTGERTVNITASPAADTVLSALWDLGVSAEVAGRAETTEIALDGHGDTVGTLHLTPEGEIQSMALAPVPGGLREGFVGSLQILAEYAALRSDA